MVPLTFAVIESAKASNASLSYAALVRIASVATVPVWVLTLLLSAIGLGWFLAGLGDWHEQLPSFGVE